MVATLPAESAVRLTLQGDTAENLMTPSPVSLRDDARIEEATAFFTGKGFGAAPVIDDAGHPIGVLSRSDILIHDREKGEAPSRRLADESIRVRDIMTPAVFSVSIDTPAAKVVKEMLALEVHRLFVVDGTGVLVGVITERDLLRHVR
jgi:predicted transcriptional regulator